MIGNKREPQIIIEFTSVEFDNFFNKAKQNITYFISKYTTNNIKKCGICIQEDEEVVSSKVIFRYFLIFLFFHLIKVILLVIFSFTY